MPLPETKAELLDNLKTAYEKLDAEFDNVALESERVCGIEGGVSCCDVLAYQIGWGRCLLAWERDENSGETADMPAPNYKWNQLGELAQSFYVEHSGKSLIQLRKEYGCLYFELCAFVNATSENDLFQPLQRQWTGKKWAMVKWIQINTIAPYKSARTKVRRWKRENI